jgi:hypothetical protein
MSEHPTNDEKQAKSHEPDSAEATDHFLDWLDEMILRIRRHQAMVEGRLVSLERRVDSIEAEKTRGEQS